METGMTYGLYDIPSAIETFKIFLVQWRLAFAGD